MGENPTPHTVNASLLCQDHEEDFEKAITAALSALREKAGLLTGTVQVLLRLDDGDYSGTANAFSVVLDGFVDPSEQAPFPIDTSRVLDVHAPDLHMAVAAAAEEFLRQLTGGEDDNMEVCVHVVVLQRSGRTGASNPFDVSLSEYTVD